MAALDEELLGKAADILASPRMTFIRGFKWFGPPATPPFVRDRQCSRRARRKLKESCDRSGRYEPTDSDRQHHRIMHSSSCFCNEWPARRLIHVTPLFRP